MSIEHEMTIRARSVKRHDRIVINSTYCLNLSRIEMRLKKVPVSTTVMHMFDNGTSVMIEDVSNILYELPSSVWLKKLFIEEDKKRDVMVQINNSAETFNGVSIE